MTDSNFKNLVSIGITTKNRWRDLEATLYHLESFGFNEVPIIIFDDGSTQRSPIEFTKFNLKIQYQRFEESLGLIVRRNQIAQTIQTKYYLSLDDDSFPVFGSLSSALNFAESQNNLLCLAFPIFNPVQNEWQSKSIHKYPYQVRFFIGCGHLLHRENFLNLGGYRDILIHQGEEMDVAIRGFQKNLYCYHFPNFLIHHTASMEGRNWFRMDFYGARNNVLWNDWYLPESLLIVKQFRNFISRILLSIKVHRFSPLQGEFIGFSLLSKYQNYRQRTVLDFYQKWIELPEK